MPIIIDGKKISKEIKDELREDVKQLQDKGISVTLAVVQVGNNPASSIYVKNKKKVCKYIGINSLAYELSDDTKEEELLKLIEELNGRDDVNGILVQLPLPPHINEDKVILTISPEKDVDGFHPMNAGRLCTGGKGYPSCTPAGVIELLKRSQIKIEGKECVVVGRSNIVGKPMSIMLLKENGTVTICHSKTVNLMEVTKRADILIAAIGKPRFFTKDYIKEGAIVIDVGIHRDENNKICGDVDYNDVYDIAGYITPVPGGVGPMTIVMLMYNCVHNMKLNKNNR